MSEPLRVLVTGVGGGGHGHEVVKALRLAGRYWLVGVDMSEQSYGLSDVDEAYKVPPASDPAYIDTLLEICKHRQTKVLIHGSEPELKKISEHRERFRDAGVLPLVNTRDVIALGMDKWATIEFLQKHGFPFPKSAMVRRCEDIPADFPFPAIVKPAVGGGGSKNTFVAQNAEELRFMGEYLVRRGAIVLVQEYVGTPHDEYTVGVLHTLDGKFVSSIALRRDILSGLSNFIKATNSTGRPELSPLLAVSSGVSQGVIDDFPEVRRACEAIAAAIQSRGPINIQCRFVNGVLYPFEINPRFSGTTYLRALAGINEPDLLIRHHVLGETLPASIPFERVRIVRGLAERKMSLNHDIAPWRAPLDS